MKRCVCLHHEHDHAQLPTGEFAGPCALCRCADFKSLGTAEGPPAGAWQKPNLGDRDDLQKLLAKRLRRRFETLFDEEALGHLASFLIESAWVLGWDECHESSTEEPSPKLVDDVAEAVSVLKEAFKDGKANQVQKRIKFAIDVLEPWLPEASAAPPAASTEGEPAKED